MTLIIPEIEHDVICSKCKKPLNGIRSMPVDSSRGLIQIDPHDFEEK